MTDPTGTVAPSSLPVAETVDQTLDTVLVLQGGKLKRAATDLVGGTTAYNLAVQQGFSGTLDEWLLSLKATPQSPLEASGTIAALTQQEQDQILQGTFVATTDGERWIYKGEGDKTDEASYFNVAANAAAAAASAADAASSASDAEDAVSDITAALGAGDLDALLYNNAGAVGVVTGVSYDAGKDRLISTGYEFNNPSAVADERRWSIEAVMDTSRSVLQIAAMTAALVVSPAYMVESNAGAPERHDWYVGASATMRLTATGLGLGTVDPSYPLDVQAASGDASARIYTAGTGADDDALLRLQIAGTTADCAVMFGDADSSNPGYIWYYHGSDYMAFGAGGSAGALLYGSGQFRITNGGSAATPALTLGGEVDTGLFVPAGNVLAFATAGAEAARIGASGEFNVGLTGGSSIYRFRVKGFGNTTATSALIVYNSDDAINFRVYDDGLIQTGTDSASPYNNTTAAAANMYVASNGSVYRSTSSLRYKRDVAPYETSLDLIRQMSPVSFANDNHPGRRYAGFIAEDFHELGLSEFVEYDVMGRPDAIHYGNVTALLTNGIKDLAGDVDALKAENAALKSRVEELESRLAA